MQKLKIFYENHRRWFYILQYLFYSAILLILVTLIDLRLLPVQEHLPDLLMTKVHLAKGILTTMAGALLTITTFTFSTILAVMTMYASNYTPRVVENFVNMRITMQVLGIFVGGFFYCISMLIFMRDRFEDEQVVAGVVAVMYSVIGIIFFVIFVQRVLTKFQGVNLIYDIAEAAAEVVRREYKNRVETSEYVYEDDQDRRVVQSLHDGYLSAIDYDGLLAKLEKKPCRLLIEAQIGSYIVKGETLAYFNIEGQFEDTEEEKNLIREIADYFHMQDRKIGSEDYRYNIEKLVEMAVRALSPGINDPSTASHIIRKLGVILSILAQTDDYHIAVQEGSHCDIFYSSYRFEEDLYEFFTQIVNYGRSDILVLRAVFDALRIMAAGATEKHKKVLQDFAKYCLEAGEKGLKMRLDTEILRSYAHRFEDLLEGRA